MQYVNLGRTGLKVSRICLGMMTYGDKSWRPWILEEAEAEPFVKRAFEAGINFYDTADVYSNGVSEQITGRLLKKYGGTRDSYVVATKVFGKMGDKPNQGGLSRKHIFEGINASLKNLDLDYIDLYQIHRWDYETPIEETMEALHDVVKSGKVRYIGASSMYAWQFAKAQHVAKMNGWTQFVSMQNHYNLVYREEEREMIPQCLDMGVGIIPWSPLARGFLAGNRERNPEQNTTTRGQTDGNDREMYYTDADFAVVDAVKAIASEQGKSPAQIALAWLLHQSGVTAPIIGASKMAQLEEAISALGIVLSAVEIARLEAHYETKPIRGHS
jgi:aryl-alcohol dehydrogenase-like predicted oxidoreductase